MKWLTNVNVATKLIGAFLMVSLIGGVIGGIGISNLQKLNESTETLYQRELLGLSYIKEANINLIYIGRATRNLILSSTKEEQQLQVERVKKFIGQLESYIDQASPLFVTEEGKRALKSFNDTWIEYKAGIQTVVDMAVKEGVSSQRQSVALLNGDLRKIAEQADDALTELSKRKEQNAEDSLADANAVFSQSRTLMLFLAFSGIALGVFLGLLIARHIGKPLQQTVEGAERIAQGDLSFNLEAERKDEFGQLLNAMQRLKLAINTLVADVNTLSNSAQDGHLNVRADADQHQGEFRKIIQGVNLMMDRITQPINEAIEVLGQVEQGDMTRSINGQYQGQFDVLKSSVNGTIHKLSRTIGEVVGAASQLSNAAEQISATSQSLSQSNSEQAASVEETSASIEQMASSINQNAENAQVTDGMAAKAAKEAREGGEAVKQTVEAMKSIATRIGMSGAGGGANRDAQRDQLRQSMQRDGLNGGDRSGDRTNGDRGGDRAGSDRMGGDRSGAERGGDRSSGGHDSSFGRDPGGFGDTHGARFDSGKSFGGGGRSFGGGGGHFGGGRR